MEFYFLNWVQLSCDFGKVVFSGTTQGKNYHHQFFFNLRGLNQLAMIMGQAITNPFQPHASPFAQH
jgi:hypothetical protein